MGHTFTQLLYHLVWSTKNRRPWLAPHVRPRLFDYLGGAIRSEGGQSILIGGVADHVHIFARLRQDKALADVIRNIKANSSGWIHETFPDLRDFSWQRGYGAFTVSFSQRDRLTHYIDTQEEHHGGQSFEDELRELLIRHEVPFDPRHYLD